jgi:hypothetical protein
MSTANSMDDVLNSTTCPVNGLLIWITRNSFIVISIIQCMPLLYFEGTLGHLSYIRFLGAADLVAHRIWFTSTSSYTEHTTSMYFSFVNLLWCSVPVIEFFHTSVNLVLFSTEAKG